jgi:hypothetical protein
VTSEERFHAGQKRLEQGDVGGVVGGLFKSLGKETRRVAVELASLVLVRSIPRKEEKAHEKKARRRLHFYLWLVGGVIRTRHT